MVVGAKPRQAVPGLLIFAALAVAYTFGAASTGFGHASGEGRSGEGRKFLVKSTIEREGWVGAEAKGHTSHTRCHGY